MNKNILSALILAIVFVGCSARMEHMPGSIENSKYAPTNSNKQYGLISYNNNGASSVKKARREDAYKQMFNACNGEYKIIDESNNSTGSTFISNGNGGGFIANMNRVYIKFLCDQ